MEAISSDPEFLKQYKESLAVQHGNKCLRSQGDIPQDEITSQLIIDLLNEVKHHLANTQWKQSKQVRTICVLGYYLANVLLDYSTVDVKIALFDDIAKMSSLKEFFMESEIPGLDYYNATRNDHIFYWSKIDHNCHLGNNYLWKAYRFFRDLNWLCINEPKIFNESTLLDIIKYIYGLYVTKSDVQNEIEGLFMEWNLLGSH